MSPSSAPSVEEVDEGFLRELGLHRLPIPVPFAEAGGPVNVVALEEMGGTWTLFDTGVGTPQGTAALEAGLKALGITASRVSRIVVSHGHEDHYGNAQILAEQSGAPVLLHRDDREKVCGENRWHVVLEQHLGFYRGLGVPEDALGLMLKAADHGQVFARQVDEARVQWVEDGALLRFKHLEGRLLQLPGHTPGLLTLHLPQARVLLADDHLLAKVSPNPVIDFVHGEGEGKFRALSRYLASARRAYALELDAVVPGHGPAFRGHRALLDGLFAFYGRRQEKVLARLAQGPATVFQVMGAVFPRWSPGILFLMLAEVLGALEVLEEAGRVEREDVHGGPWRLVA